MIFFVWLKEWFISWWSFFFSQWRTSNQKGTAFPSVFGVSDQWSTWPIVLSLIVESSQILIVFVLKNHRWDLREKIKKIFRWRENTTDTIHLNIHDRTWIASFTLRTDSKEKYWIWSRDFISESIVSIPLSHPRTNVVSIPIDRKEIDITLNKNSMMPFVSWIALLKFR